jgi:glycerophosphoryl diester phosphodiesterase
LAHGLYAPEIVAHRGASYDAPENTLSSIALAWHQDADAVEIDVHLSRDGEVIVMHDCDTRRTTGFEGKISSLTLSQIRNLEAGAWKQPWFAGERVPTLDDVLEILPWNKRLFIEIKSDGAILGPLKASLERNAVAPDQIVFIAFDFTVVRAAKVVFPQYQVLWLRGTAALKEHRGKVAVWMLDEMIRACREAHLDGLNLSCDWIEHWILSDRVRRVGLKFCVHTVNDGALARHLAEGGIDSITTDRPGWMRERLLHTAATLA